VAHGGISDVVGSGDGRHWTWMRSEECRDREEEEVLVLMGEGDFSGDNKKQQQKALVGGVGGTERHPGSRWTTGTWLFIIGD